MAPFHYLSKASLSFRVSSYLLTVYQKGLDMKQMFRINIVLNQEMI